MGPHPANPSRRPKHKVGKLQWALKPVSGAGSAEAFEITCSLPHGACRGGAGQHTVTGPRGRGHASSTPTPLNAKNSSAS